jgi:DNA helicase-2/ATP-dependent DNA helicase PcrA
MTIHLAKGLEFPFVYIVGMEEDLFPSAMSMNTRSELEEERRLFYVALTRAEERAFLTYTLSRYRWGKLIDAEPSRFIEEIDDRFVEMDIPKDNYTFKPLLDASIFGEPTQNRPSKPLPKDVKLNTQPTPAQLGKLRKISAQQASVAPSKEVLNLAVGMRVSHTRFGKGTVKTIEGQGNDKKALIAFPKPHGEKNLLLRFAKLQILS